MKNRSLAAKVMIMGSAFVTFAILAILIGYIVIKGAPHLTAEMFERTYTTENVSMFPAIITTLIVVVLSLIVATPIGIFTGF